MRFAEPLWLLGTAVALVVAGFLILGAWLSVRALRRFGDEERVLSLLTGNASSRRALKGALLVLGVALAFVALSKPQYGRGTRLIPATNLDVVIVLDYSKSMFARDVKPSRAARAKAEVGQLIGSLPGARFAAVAFAGQPMSFPLTSDGSAIAQFFRQLSPNDMPVGGTAIARALEAGRELLARDPLSKKHRRVMVLVTDGEDLEGDPVAVAQAAKMDDITVHVVQIGGRTPEPLPDVNESGEVTGWRMDDEGAPLTTSLSADGEAQLAKVAEATGGRIVRSERGTTGLREIEVSLKRMMTEELSERVETVYADVFIYPLALAVLLLLIESFVSETKKRTITREPPPPEKRAFRRRRRDAERAAAASIVSLVALAAAIASGCERDRKLFERHAPQVDDAIQALDAGDASAASSLLEQYLETGRCDSGQIGTPPRLRERPSASFDLGLALFQLAERYGQRFGEEEVGLDAGTPQQDTQATQRKAEVECALRVVGLIAGDGSIAIELRARGHYLAGNLNFLLREYRAAVTNYDAALKLTPGLAADAGDPIGRDAAWNRAIALRRIEEQEPPDAGPDAAPDAADAAPEAGPDGGNDDGGQDAGDSGEDAGADGGSDAGNDASGQNSPDAGADSGPDAASPPEPQATPEPPPSANQDERMLDMLEQAPTLQEEAAKNRALQGRVRGMQDK
jgi:Ca-activated chloride channel family protein